MSDGKKQGGGNQEDASTPQPDDPNLTLDPPSGNDDPPTEPDNQDDPRWR